MVEPRNPLTPKNLGDVSHFYLLPIFLRIFRKCLRMPIRKTTGKNIRYLNVLKNKNELEENYLLERNFNKFDFLIEK